MFKFHRFGRLFWCLFVSSESDDLKLSLANLRVYSCTVRKHISWAFVLKPRTQFIFVFDESHIPSFGKPKPVLHPVRNSWNLRTAYTSAFRSVDKSSQFTVRNFSRQRQIYMNTKNMQNEISQ